MCITLSEILRINEIAILMKILKRNKYKLLKYGRINKCCVYPVACTDFLLKKHLLKG